MADAYAKIGTFYVAGEDVDEGVQVMRISTNSNDASLHTEGLGNHRGQKIALVEYIPSGGGTHYYKLFINKPNKIAQIKPYKDDKFKAGTKLTQTDYKANYNNQNWYLIASVDPSDQSYHTLVNVNGFDYQGYIITNKAWYPSIKWQIVFDYPNGDGIELYKNGNQTTYEIISWIFIPGLYNGPDNGDSYSLGTPSSVGVSLSQAGEIVSKLPIDQAITVYPRWKLSNNKKFMIRYRHRDRTVGDMDYGDWSYWSCPYITHDSSNADLYGYGWGNSNTIKASGSSASNFNGIPNESNLTSGVFNTETLNGINYYSTGISIEQAGSNVDLRQYQIQVRAFQASTNGYYENLGSAAGTGTFTLGYTPTINSQHNPLLLVFTATGLDIQYTLSTTNSTQSYIFTRGNNTLDLSDFRINGHQLCENIHKEGMDASGTIHIPIDDLYVVPSEGDTVSFISNIVTSDDFSNLESVSAEVTIGTGHGLDDISYEQVVTNYFNLLNVVTQRTVNETVVDYDICRAFLIYNHYGEDLVEECISYSDLEIESVKHRIFLMTPPLNSEYYIMLLCSSGDDWNVLKFQGDPVYSSSLLWNYNNSVVELKLFEDSDKIIDSTVQHLSDSFYQNDTRYPTYAYRSVSTVDLSVSGVVSLSDISYGSLLPEFDLLLKNGYALYRDMDGNRANVAVLSIKKTRYFKTQEHLYRITISQEERS